MLPKHTLFKVLYFILAKCKNYTLYFFQSNTLKILYYRIKLSKRIKSTLFILLFLKYLIHVSSLLTNEHIPKDFFTGIRCSHKQYIYFSNCVYKYMIFHKKLYFGGVFICKSYFTYTLFQVKSYFI